MRFLDNLDSYLGVHIFVIFLKCKSHKTKKKNPSSSVPKYTIGAHPSALPPVLCHSEGLLQGSH